MTSSQQTKASIRQQLRQQRNTLTAEQQEQAAEQLLTNALKLDAFMSAKHIALYLPSDGEISPVPVLHKAHQLGKQCYLPVIDADDRLFFSAYQPGDPLQDNRYGIAEPSQPQPVEREALDLILLPLVGFDSSGNRLGMGGGYYDKYLDTDKDSSRLPMLFGLAHSCQEVSKLDSDSWDVPLNGVITDSKSMLLDG